MIWPSQVDREIRRGVRTFLFVDDFLGTGFQFHKFAQSNHLEEKLTQPEVTFIYAPLIAFYKGIDRLKHKLPRLLVSFAEELDDSYCLFSHNARYFNDGTNSSYIARVFYSEFLRARGITSLGKFTFGYARLGLAIAFNHATPNASLPLFWVDHQHLRPLFLR
jgi:hypothetical protein